MHFLGFPDTLPEYSTVWYFRERLAETGQDRVVWAELQRQLDENGLKVKKGVVQDATFITGDPGRAPVDKPKDEEASTRRSRDSALTKEGKQVQFWVQAAREDRHRSWLGARLED